MAAALLLLVSDGFGFVRTALPAGNIAELPATTNLLKYNLKHRLARDKELREICGVCTVACRLLVLRQNMLRSEADPSAFRKRMQAKLKNLDYEAGGGGEKVDHRQGPDFVIIGGQKTGTTALYNYMLASPRFAWPSFVTLNNKKFKEAHFFDHCIGVATCNTFYYEKQAPESGYWCDAQLYRQLFQSCGKKTCGDASPSYMMYPEMPLLAHVLLPAHTKLIVMLREPLARAVSGFFQLNFHGLPITFEEAVQPELEILAACEADVPNVEERYAECIWPRAVERSLRSTLGPQKVGEVGPNATWWSLGTSNEAKMKPRQCTSNAINHESVLIRGLYYFQLRSWLETFGPERVMVLGSDAFFQTPVETTETVIDFVSQHQSAAYVAASKRAEKRAGGSSRLAGAASNTTLRNSQTPAGFTMSAELRAKIQKVYAPYNALLYKLLAKHNIPHQRFP